MATSKDLKKLNLEEAALESEARIRALENEKKQAITSKDRLAIQKQISKEILYQESVTRQILKLEEDERSTLESISESLQDQIRTLKTKQRINGKLSEVEEQQLNRTELIHKQLLAQKITQEKASKLLKSINRDAKFRLQIEEHITKTQQAYAAAVAKVNAKIKESQLKSATQYVKGIETNIRKIPVIGDLMANTLMGPKAQRNLTARFFKYFRKNPKLFNTIAGKAGGLAVASAAALITGFKLASKQSEVMKDIRRTLGLTNDEAKEFRDMSIGMLFDSNSMATTQKEILEAAAQLSNTYGTSVKNNEKLVNNQITLTKGFGLQADEAEKINMLADATGQDYEKQLHATVATAQATGKVYKYSFNTNKVLADVAKLSASIQASFKGSTASMAKAVIQTKLMGTTLTQLDSVADNLLQIESSIENQVTAQLVTGKNINLDKARMLALNNDLVGVGQELVNQGIDYATFSKMNRVEMQSTAAAMGMQKDELADMLLKQEVYKRAGADIRATDSASLKLNEEKIKSLAAQGDEEANKYIQSQKQLSIQERMTAAMEKFSAVMETIYYIFIGIGVALAVASAILTFGASIPFLAGLSSTALGVTAAVSGGTVGAGAMIGAKQMVSDGIAPSSNGPFTITDRYGTTAVTANGDGLAVSPNINTGSSNNKETNDLLRQLIAKVDQPAIIKMGDTTINELGNKTTLKRDYRAGVGNTYNRIA